MMKHTPSSSYFGTRRKEKIRRILIPVFLGVSIIAVTLMLGNLLQDRLTAAEPLLALPAASYPEKDTTIKTPAQLLLHKEKHISDVTAKILFKHSSLSDSTDILVEGTADDDFCCKYTIKVKNNINNLELDLSTGEIDFKSVSYPELYRIITEVTQKVLANESVYSKIRDFIICT